MTDEQKREMVKRMTEVTMEVLGTPEESHHIVIDELTLESIAVGKKTVGQMVEEMKFAGK